MSAADRIKILFLGASPTNRVHLHLDEEVRAIEHRLRVATHRDMIELVTKWAVRPDDLMQALNEHRPHVVHFSGHGSADQQLVLVGDDGGAKPVEKEAIAALFRVLRHNVRIVVLNACHSSAQAREVAKSVDCVVGMQQAIGDAAARSFAAAFYRALAFGSSVKNAFEQGRVALLMEGIGEAEVPELAVRKGVDPDRVCLLSGGRALELGLVREGCQLLDDGAIDKAEKKFSEACTRNPGSSEPWYGKARAALVRDNQPVAMAYLDKAIALHPQHVPSLALKIRVLLLNGGTDVGEAQRLANRCYGLSRRFDEWLDCLAQADVFSGQIITVYELDMKCPHPEYKWE